MQIFLLSSVMLWNSESVVFPNLDYSKFCGECTYDSFRIYFDVLSLVNWIDAGVVGCVAFG